MNEWIELRVKMASLMKPELFISLALVLGGGLTGCSKAGRTASENPAPRGDLFETHALKGRPTVAIYIHGFVDSAFDA